ncbi:hypothetical protein FH972_012802 [Carpinus fangiana]|uniref:Uncharacterized protein n=1 Tax=Carpinus fangiana TaxID=176857 RepID=A0A5N6R4T3_9ROSI|nr:hypothetical protein FH972_012802 [Carpinus fangiana]
MTDEGRVASRKEGARTECSAGFKAARRDQQQLGSLGGITGSAAGWTLEFGGKT